jgi:hypothetical protein
MDGSEYSICRDTDACQNDEVLLPAWFSARQCLITQLTRSDPPDRQAYVFFTCPCEVEGYVVDPSSEFVSAEGSNVCDFVDEPDPGCENVSVDACFM